MNICFYLPFFPQDSEKDGLTRPVSSQEVHVDDDNSNTALDLSGVSTYRFRLCVNS
jgi:hypothetical protein